MSDIQLTSTVPSNFNHLSIKSKLKEFQFVLKNSTTDCLFATIPFAIQCKMCYHCVGGGEQHCIKRAPMHHQNFYGLQDAKFVINCPVCNLEIMFDVDSYIQENNYVRGNDRFGVRMIG